MYSQLGPAVRVVVGVVGLHDPVDQVLVARSNSWLPTAETSRPASLSASRVGLSFWTNDSNVEAPIRSPAATKTELPGSAARSCFDRTGQLGGTAVGAAAVAAGRGSRCCR